MRLALAQINITPEAISKNLQQIEKAINTAKQQKADLLLFPELVTTGYTPNLLKLGDPLTPGSAAGSSGCGNPPDRRFQQPAGRCVQGW